MLLFSAKKKSRIRTTKNTHTPLILADTKASKRCRLDFIFIFGRFNVPFVITQYSLLELLVFAFRPIQREIILNASHFQLVSFFLFRRVEWFFRREVREFEGTWIGNNSICFQHLGACCFILHEIRWVDGKCLGCIEMPLHAQIPSTKLWIHVQFELSALWPRAPPCSAHKHTRRFVTPSLICSFAILRFFTCSIALLHIVLFCFSFCWTTTSTSTYVIVHNVSLASTGCEIT